jgi:uncharacterized membrane protein HdeD (DUF308 family)
MALKRKRQWWLQALRGLALFIFGLFCLFNSDMTVAAIITVLGAFVLAIGAVLLIGLAATKMLGNNFATIEGVIDVVIGLLVVINPVGTAKLLVIIIAIWAIVMGIIQILAALRIRDRSALWTLPLGSGILTLILGILLLSDPFEGAQAMIILIGIFALIVGVGLMINSASKNRIEVE